jgi:hypothetical protein
VSTYDSILVHADLSLPEISERLESALRLERFVNSQERVFLVRRHPGAGVRELGGELSRSIFRIPPDLPEDEPSVVDGYAYDWQIGTVPRSDDDELISLSRGLFRDLARAVDWPAILVHNNAALLAASSPKTGLVEFEPGVSPDVDNQEQWRAFDVLER